ncbi:hypothetical protein ACFUNF_21630 [Streptomyces sp. NPDC057291]|uniref:hypothetical protein n=1 Tax=Streptomyces sp. NPDC057291 TaxID=3346087 RepID=UPI00362B4008
MNDTGPAPGLSPVPDETANVSSWQERTPSAQLIEMIGLARRQIRLLSMVHEAGHVVVADTVGAPSSTTRS